MDCLRRRGRRALLRGGRRRVVRPSRGRLRDDVAGHADAKWTSRSERIAIDEAARRWPQVSFDDVAFAVLEPESGLLMARRGVAAVARRVAELGGASEVAEARPGRVEGSRLLDVELGDGPAGRGRAVRVRLRTVAADAVPRGRWAISSRSPSRTSCSSDHAPETPASGPAHSPAGSTTTPRITAFPRSTGGASRSRRTATASRSTHPRTTGLSTPTRSASLAATWRAASPTSPTGRSWRPAPASTRRPRTRNFVIDRHPAFDNVWLVGGGSGHGFKHGPSIGRYVTRLLDGHVAEGEETRFRIDRSRTPAATGAGARRMISE